jgi:hypothetical protein
MVRSCSVCVPTGELILMMEFVEGGWGNAVNSLHLYFHVRMGAGQGSALYDVVEESEHVERYEYVYFV